MSEESQRILTAIGRAMARAAAPGWERVEVTITGAGPMSGTTVAVVDGNGVTDRSAGLDDEGQDAADELRRDMYQPGKGTWYNATVTLTNSGKLNAGFDYDNPPFGGDADADLLLEDQRLFPRDPEHLPAWHPARS
jgi:hypothetical protein